MNNGKIDLHLNRKKVIAYELLITMLLSALNLLSLIALKENAVQLNSLLNSQYLYSATMKPSADVDDYICFDADISFKVSKEANKSINANVIMQSLGATYTDAVFWNTVELKTNEIAVSLNIANNRGLRIGDVLYSKHIVNDEIREYQIKAIIPDAVFVRVGDESFLGKGIIVMGYDEQLAENISHSHLVFSNRSINELFDYSQGTLTSIIYREDEILTTCFDLLPYIIAFLLCNLFVSLVLVLLIKKDIAYNFKRMIIIGFKKSKMKKAFYLCVIGICEMTYLTVLVISTCFVLIFAYPHLFIIYGLLLFLFESILTTIFANRINSKLWRN